MHRRLLSDMKNLSRISLANKNSIIHIAWFRPIKQNHRDYEEVKFVAFFFSLDTQLSVLRCFGATWKFMPHRDWSCMLEKRVKLLLVFHRKINQWLWFVSMSAHNFASEEAREKSGNLSNISGAVPWCRLSSSDNHYSNVCPAQQAMTIRQQIRWQMNLHAVLKEKLLSSMIDPARPPRSAAVQHRWGGRCQSLIWIMMIRDGTIFHGPRNKTKVLADCVVPGHPRIWLPARNRLPPNQTKCRSYSSCRKIYLSNNLAVALRQANRGG